MSFKVVILLGVIAFVRSQEGKLDNGSLDSLIDGAISHDNAGGADDPPKVKGDFLLIQLKLINLFSLALHQMVYLESVCHIIFARMEKLMTTVLIS